MVRLFAAAGGFAVWFGAAAIAQPSAAPPDFSGVYYNARPAGAAPPAAASPRNVRPTASAPVLDGSQGRPANLPPLTPEYLGKWDEIAKSRTAGSSEYDSSAKCLPPGMPYMMGNAYGMEITQTTGRMTIFSEWMDALRRIYLDGRKPSNKVLDDPTYAGYSTGRWEGDTLVVDTVALRDDTQLDGLGAPHSGAMTIQERIRFIAPGMLEDRIVVTDPKALTRPWESVRTYRKAAPPNDELREFACAEGLDQAK